MNLLLDHVDDESEVNITDGNFEELQSLCRELEFSGLDAELSEFASRFKARRRIEKPAPPPMKEVETFEYQRGKGFHGIIAYLTRKFGGNVLEKGVINIMGSGKNDGAVVDFGSNKEYHASKGYMDRWICFDFNKWCVVPTRYTLKSDFGDPGVGAHLKSWIVDVSNDGYSWTEIDRKVNKDNLNEGCTSVNFTCTKPPRESVRFFRIRQIGKNHAGWVGFRIAALEIFGTLFVTENTEQPEPREREIVYQPGKEGQSPPPLFPPKLDGLIAHLTLQCGGNVHDRRLVYVMGEGKNPRDVVDLGSTFVYRAVNFVGVKEPWVCYDFNERRVIPTSYSVQSYPIFGFLKSWVVEVSNDGCSWTEIDRRVNNNDLKGEDALGEFNLSRPPREGFRFFRLRQIGPNHSGDFELWIAALELFGTLLVTEKTKQPEPREQEFMYHPGKEGQSPPPLFHPKLCGIIAHLTLQYGGNLHDCGIVDVDSSDFTRNPDALPKWVIDLGNKCAFESDDEKNAWISYDFKNRRVIPKSYSIMAFFENAPKSWVIEVSNDEEVWKRIDQRSKTNDLKGEWAMANFEVDRIPSNGFRFFRLRQTGQNHDGDDSLELVALEIFGTLYEKKKPVE